MDRGGADHAPFKLGLADEAHVVSSTGLAHDSLLYLAGGRARPRSRCPMRGPVLSSAQPRRGQPGAGA